MSQHIQNINIGVLEIQGSFLEHKNALVKATEQIKQYISLNVREIRHSQHITNDLHGLIIPGGESTAISLFLKRNKMEEPLRSWIRNRSHVTWGTCAGMILLAKDTDHKKQGGQILLKCMDTVVSRNYFGRQINSFEADLKMTLPLLKLNTNSDVDYFHGVFIRAPAILKITDASVEVLASVENTDGTSVIVAAQQHNMLCTSFHPELTDDTRWHQYFIQMVLDRTQH